MGTRAQGPNLAFNSANVRGRGDGVGLIVGSIDGVGLTISCGKVLERDFESFLGRNTNRVAAIATSEQMVMIYSTLLRILDILDYRAYVQKRGWQWFAPIIKKLDHVGTHSS